MKAEALVHERVKDYSATSKTFGAVGVEVSWRKTVAAWPEELREEFEERAAILEFDAGLDRRTAEQRAYVIVRDVRQAVKRMREGPL